MIDLDDPASLALDASGMFDHVRASGAELVHAWQASVEMTMPPLHESIDAIVVAGMGGSATAGDYFATLCAATSPIPVIVVRGPTLPAFVSERTLVVVSSYSGETSESLACYAAALKRDARLIAITAGGTLAARAKADGVPRVGIDYQSPPRAAIAHTIAPLLRIGASLEICAIDDAIIDDAAGAYDAFVAGRLAPEVRRSHNTAKQLAECLWQRTPLILGGEHFGPVTTRFKNQLAENGKTLAIAEVLPEAAHNIVVGLQTMKDGGSQLAVVLLQSTIYTPAAQRVAHEIRDLFAQHQVPVTPLDVPGASPLDQMLTATALGDYASCYLALLNGVDPTPIPEIDRMRAVTKG